jgi:hypothetical protein
VPIRQVGELGEEKVLAFALVDHANRSVFVGTTRVHQVIKSEQKVIKTIAVAAAVVVGGGWSAAAGGGEW